MSRGIKRRRLLKAFPAAIKKPALGGGVVGVSCFVGRLIATPPPNHIAMTISDFTVNFTV